jgi:hypothetical protein
MRCGTTRLPDYAVSGAPTIDLDRTVRDYTRPKEKHLAVLKVD